MKDYSNYHNTNYTEKLLRDGTKTFERSLSTSPDSYTVIVNNIEKEVMVQSTSNYNERRILFKKDDINIGDVVKHENRNWLVTEIPFFNKIHSKSKMIMCTQTLTVPTESEERILGYDNLGRPITKIVEGKSLAFPCVVQSLNEQLNEGDLDGQINVPSGKIVLYIQNTTNANIYIGKEFSMFGMNYRIFGLNRSKVVDNKGILMITADKIT